MYDHTINEVRKPTSVLVETTSLIPKKTISTKVVFIELLKNSSFPTIARFFAVSSDFMMAYYLSQLGKEGLSASSLIAPYTGLLKTVLASSMYAISLNVRGKLRDNKDNETNSSFHVGLAIAAIETAPASLLTYFYPTILKQLNQPIASINVLDKFFKQYMWGLPANIVLFVHINFAKGLQLPKAILAHVVPSKILLSIIGYPMTLGKWGIPKMNSNGLGIAYSSCIWLSCASFSLYYLLGKSRKQHSLLKSSRKVFCKDFKSVALTALKLSSFASFEYIFLLGNTLYCGRYGVDALAAAEIANQYGLLLSIPVKNISQASGVIIKKYFNKENKALITKFSLLTLLSSLSLPAINIALTFMLKDKMVTLFFDINEENMTSILLAKELLTINAWSLIPLTARNISAGLLKGSGKTHIPAIASLITDIVIGGVATYFFGNILKLETQGAFWARTLSFSISSVLLCCSWFIVQKKPPEVDTSNTVSKKNNTTSWCSFWKSSNKKAETHIEETSKVEKKKKQSCCILA